MEFADGYEGVTRAGIALVALDTGRVLLAQRAMDETDDPEVQETWEFPGGGLDEGENAQAGAFREFREEMGVDLESDADLEQAANVVDGWRAGPEDNYQGFVATRPVEEDVEASIGMDRSEVQDFDWVPVADLRTTTGLRPEMVASMDTWLPLLEAAVSGNQEENMADETTEPEATEPEWDALLASVEPIPVHGVVAPEDVPTGDRRMFAAGAMTKRPLRLPFSHQKAAIGGHDGSIVVGSVDRMMRKDGLVHWEGLLMPAEDTDEFVNMLAFFGRTGVSVDGDNGSLDLERSDAENIAVFDKVRAAGLTSVAIPAFHQAYVAFGWHPTMPGDEEALTASLYDAGDMVGGRVEFKRGAGWVTNPKETNRLHDYWTKKGQPGYAKIGWGTPGDFTRAKALIGEKIAKNSPDKMKYLNQIIAQWHFDALGYWPGDLGKPGNAPDTPENRRRAARHATSAEGTITADLDEEVDVAAIAEQMDREDIVANEEGWEAVLG